MLAAIQKEITRQFGDRPLDNPDYGKIINEKHFERILGLIAKEKIICGGESDSSTLRIAPTVLTDVSWDDPVMGEEIFGPLLPVLTYSSLDEAIAHINKYNTGHSEAIITENYSNAQKFLDEVDAAAVYVNASTRFTDGFEFGYGAEIGISTQKLHARGPMGLLALTTTKYIIYGNGQIRP